MLLGGKLIPPLKAGADMREHLNQQLHENQRRPDLVLVADDHVEDRIYLCHILTRQGAAVRMATDGAEAVRIAQEAAFDLILMDVSMPRMDGFATVRQIREIERATGQPPAYIQMTTGHGEMEDMVWSQEAGADGHLVKPIEPRLIVKALYEARLRRVQGGIAELHEPSKVRTSL